MPSVPGAVLLALALSMLVVTLVLSVATLRQVGLLSGRVGDTQAIVDANVRTLTQVQRELLLLDTMLADGASADELDLQGQLVSQRVQEGSLSYQEQTLRAEDLLALARADQRRWDDDLLPRLEALGDVADRPGAEGPAVRALRQDVMELERSHNQLVSDGENNRKAQAGLANDDAERLLSGARLMVGGLFATFALGLLALVLGLVVARRASRQREADREALVTLNQDLERYAHIVHATSTMVVWTDVRGRIIWVNPAFEAETGWALAEVVGRSPGDFLQGPGTDPATVREMGERLRRGERFTAEVLNYHRDGHEMWVALDVTPLREEAAQGDGALTGFVAVQSDVTERREAAALLEVARREAEATAADRAAFLATMSHEIRTPLNAVLGLTELLAAGELDPEQRDFALTAQRSGRHLLSLVNDILDFSALDAGGVTSSEAELSLVETVDDVAAMFASEAQGKGLELQVRRTSSAPDRVRGDVVHLRQVLVNLVGNAVKFTDTGSVAVEVSRDSEGAVVLEVRDTGIGVPQWRIPSLFQPFTRGDVSATRRHGGTGLGLAISRGLARAMGGDISLTSVLGEGTTVTVRLPLAPVGGAETAAPPVGAALTADVGAALRVLVAEDDPINQKVITAMLRRCDLDAVVVPDGLAAVEAVRSAAGRGEPFDLVLMDMQMPVMDGMEATEVVSLEHPGLPVVALSANVLPADRDRMLAAGAVGYLTKPVSLASLLDVVRTHTGVAAR